MYLGIDHELTYAGLTSSRNLIYESFPCGHRMYLPDVGKRTSHLPSRPSMVSVRPQQYCSPDICLRVRNSGPIAPCPVHLRSCIKDLRGCHRSRYDWWTLQSPIFKGSTTTVNISDSPTVPRFSSYSIGGVWAFDQNGTRTSRQSAVQST
nr:hypothetical protein CFP56_54852 [Quercus suber]